MQYNSSWISFEKLDKINLIFMQKKMKSIYSKVGYEKRKAKRISEDRESQ